MGIRNYFSNKTKSKTYEQNLSQSLYELLIHMPSNPLQEIMKYQNIYEPLKMPTDITLL